MSVRVMRFPELDVTLIVYSGLLTPRALLDGIGELGPEDVAHYINYGAPNLDISGIDVASLPELRRALGERLRRLTGGRRVRSALVSDAKSGALTTGFWPSYIGHDDSFPVESVRFDSLEAACRWCGLSDAGCRAVIETVEACLAAAGE